MILTDPHQIQNADFLAGVSLLVDKPKGWTSFDVVNKIRFLLRKKLGVKKIKVGHAGTLDPLATGLLIIAIGKDTKKIENYQAQHKSYSGVIRLGAITASYDSEFEPDQHFEISHITTEMIEKARHSFLGEIEQVPPIFSALKVDGKRAYTLARKGDIPTMKSRKVHIYKFDLDVSTFPDINFIVDCEKGTYIRSLAHDFGKALGAGAYLAGLRRIGIGKYKVEKALTIETIIEWLEK